ncbi:MAG: hypothetical protein ACK5TN_22015 [Acidobacteriota bacterium]
MAESAKRFDLLGGGWLGKAPGDEKCLFSAPNQLSHTALAEKPWSPDVAEATFPPLDKGHESVAGHDEMGGELEGSQKIDIGGSQACQDFLHRALHFVTAEVFFV